MQDKILVQISFSVISFNAETAGGQFYRRIISNLGMREKKKNIICVFKLI